MTGVVRPLAAIVVLAVVVVALPPSLSADARAAVFAFGLAVVLWSLTKLTPAWVALACVLVLVALGGAGQEAIYSSLASDVVWLMIGAFVLGGAVQTSGLAARLTGVVARRSGTVGRAFWGTTVILVPLSLLIPSTSGRAAVVLPVYRSITRSAGDPRVSRALALLVPTVILVSTISTLVGAGSHLLTNDLLEQVTGERISFGQWLLYGAPFGVAASVAACAVITRMFLTSDQRRAPLTLDAPARRSLSTAERRCLLILTGMVAAWMTESLHGVQVATVAVLGAALLTAPTHGVITWKQGLAAVSWNLVVFVGAALVLGQALIDTGAAQWIVDRLFALGGLTTSSPTLLVVLVLGLLTLTSHVYMTSHAARAAALVPALLYLAQTLELNPVAVVFIGTVGIDYCLTFAVSSKALLLYSELDEPTFEPPDLLRLSAVLLAVHVGLLVLFATTYWPAVGLSL